MSRTVAMAFGRFGLLAAASLSLWASGSGWAQQREAKLLISPMTERPIILVTCTRAEVDKCKADVTSKCGADKNCAGYGIAQCEAPCELPKPR
jgi:hypothetical protein